MPEKPRKFWSFVKACTYWYLDHTIDDVVVSADDVFKVLSTLDTKKACGPDGISPRILKECAHELSNSLAALFNYTLTVGKLPQDWKVANIVAIYKSGERCSAENYRPISLTCIVNC